MTPRHCIQLMVSRCSNDGREGSAVRYSIVLKSEEADCCAEEAAKEGDTVGDYEVFAVVFVDVLGWEV